LIGEYDNTGTEIKTYGYKPGSTWTTDPLFMKIGGDYYFYQNDHLGKPQKMTGDNGAVVWSGQYSSFGEATVDAASTITNNLRFPGQYYDEATGLHYNYNRYYDPRLGRYLRADPIGLRRASNNLYVYVYNNVHRFIDELGLYCKRTSKWKRRTVIEEADNKGTFVYSIYKKKWRKIGEYNALPLPTTKGDPDVAELGCGCLWRSEGYVKESWYIKNISFEATFRCGIDECPVKEWEEKQFKEFPIQYPIQEPVESSIESSDNPFVITTPGIPVEGVCLCKPPQV
jgi:RHS repeat-associated protein